MSMKKKILALLFDACSDVMYYDRKECEDVPQGAIEDAIISGEITIEEMTESFTQQIGPAVTHRKKNTGR